MSWNAGALLRWSDAPASREHEKESKKGRILA
jgi:hypothetical protein